MTKGEAIQAFFNQFLTAYPASAVPQDVVFPWLTYELVTGSWGDGDLSLQVNLWYYTTSEADPNAMAERLSREIGRGGVLLPCDGGAIWVKRGSPWCQSVPDADKAVKRRLINLSVEFLTQ